MDVRQCKRCHKIFQYSGTPLCPACVQESDRQFNDVRNYIYENPHATLDMVCEATEVEQDDIRRWLREGRLILQKGSAALIQCEKCGAPITTGKLCPQCINSVQSQLSEAANAMRPTPAPEKPKDYGKGKDKMHITRR